MNSFELRLLVGLGNPGEKYKNTRHNIGFRILEELSKQEAISFKQSKKMLGYIAEIGIGEKKQKLLMPTTFMNESGRAISATINWFDLDINHILVLVDDMDLPLGKLRLRSKGGSGGHKGLKSTIEHLGTQEFFRLRIGIGAPLGNQEERKQKTASHVLGRFSSEEATIVEETISKVLTGLKLIKEVGINKAGDYLNSSNQKEV